MQCIAKPGQMLMQGGTTRFRIHHQHPSALHAWAYFLFYLTIVQSYGMKALGASQTSLLKQQSSQDEGEQNLNFLTQIATLASQHIKRLSNTSSY